MPRAIDLSGKPIAITGASSGIGRAAAVACARAGMPVALGARRVDKLEEVAREIRALGGRALVRAIDVTQPEDCAALVEDARREFGGLYAVYANAGYGFEKPLIETSDREIRDLFETNFWGTLNTVRPALAAMQGAGSGHIVICSSCISKIGVPFYAPYSASKACQDHFARALRIELGGTGISVSSIHPIGTRTEFFSESDKRSGAHGHSSHTPETFMQTPERVARAIVRCLQRPRGEVWTSTPVRLAFAAMTAFPGLADVALRHYSRRRDSVLAKVTEAR